MLFPNPRGSFGAGESFARSNVRDFGQGDLRDILLGVDEIVRTLPVDPMRLESRRLELRRIYDDVDGHLQTRRFRAAVAGAGIANWQSYYRKKT